MTSGAINNSKVSVAGAHGAHSERHHNSEHTVCYSWSGRDASGRNAHSDTVNNKQAGCNHPHDIVHIENNARPNVLKSNNDTLPTCLLHLSGENNGPNVKEHFTHSTDDSLPDCSKQQTPLMSASKYSSFEDYGKHLERDTQKPAYFPKNEVLPKIREVYHSHIRKHTHSNPFIPK